MKSEVSLSRGNQKLLSDGESVTITNIESKADVTVDVDLFLDFVSLCQHEEWREDREREGPRLREASNKKMFRNAID